MYGSVGPQPCTSPDPLHLRSAARLRLLVLRLGDSLFSGLVALGQIYCAIGAEYWQQQAIRQTLRGPGPGHPERLIPALAPSPEEIDLWRELTATGRLNVRRHQTWTAD
jgi:hypothetical protein